MTWDIDCESWEQFPIAQKWFAVGEAIAHLRYLESERRIKRNTDQKIANLLGTLKATIPLRYSAGICSAYSSKFTAFVFREPSLSASLSQSPFASLRG
ncbi:MAG: hypothetical protein MZV65_19755 [Chromatiales bacterium]|nr:hypothetical protein [Chromatiales bacterium]